MELKKYFIPIVDRHIKIRLYIFPYFFILLYLSIFRLYQTDKFKMHLL